MPGFAIYYGDGSVVEGATKEDWEKAPDTGVQVVVSKEPPPEPFPVSERFTTGIVGCKKPVTFYTGVDVYDPFGWGPKEGSLLSDEDYFAIWERAYGN